MTPFHSLRRPRLVLAAALLAGAGALPVAGADAPLTLSAAVETALGRYPSLAAARARLAETAAALGEARAASRPSFRLGLSGLHYDDPMVVSPIHAFTPDQFPPLDETLLQGSLNLSYTLFDSGARRQRTLQASEMQAAAAAALGAAEQAVAARVVTAYGNALARQQVLAAEQERLAALRLELDRVRQLLEVGRAPEVERLRAEATLASAEAERSRAATALDSAERDLARLLGAEVEETRAADLAPLTAPAAPAAARAELQRRAVASSPLVEQARRQAAGADAARALARTAWFPELKLVGAVLEFAAPGIDATTDWNAGVQLAVPLWDGGTTGQRVARAAAAADAARGALDQAELDAREAVDRALAAFEDATARATAFERAASRLVEVARVQKLLLEVGSGTQIDYLAAESELAATRARLAESETAARLARVELARATGELSPDWLRRNLETAP